MTSQTVEKPAATGRAKSLLLIAMCLGMALTMYNSTLVNTIATAIGTSLHTGSSGVQWISAGYTLCYGALLLTGGAYGNRIGRRTAFLAGTAAFAIASLGCALAPDLAVLLVFRALQAASAAVLLPPTLSILVYEYSGPARARAVGIWAGVASLGLSAGPVLGGVIIEFGTWRIGFVLSFALGAAALWLASVTVSGDRHGRPEHAVRIDATGAVLSVIALGGLVFGLIESPVYGWTSPVIIGCLVIFVAGLVLFVLAQGRMTRRGRDALMPLELWRASKFTAANGAGLFYFICFIGIIFFYSAQLQVDWHASALVVGLSFLPMTLIQAALAPVAGRLAGRIGAIPVLAAGLTIGGAGCLLLGLLPRHGASLLDLEWRLAVVGVGSGFMSSPMSTLAVSAVPQRHSTTAAAVHNTFRQTGATLAVAALGVIVGPLNVPGMDAGVDRAMLLTGALLIAWAAVSLAITRRAGWGPPRTTLNPPPR